MSGYIFENDCIEQQQEEMVNNFDTFLSKSNTVDVQFIFFCSRSELIQKKSKLNDKNMTYECEDDANHHLIL
ncbi:CLUMA_CG004386, isoform A [Clunio marinus]|uniref:CLUMA_CG004386, isoform A n=1 Tax=Clunio marinus TaxID=568069 RepID=A0A1J1HX30_9DIPT|nr:CLUMA_CG004386, isoform A [Clunio marinus]